MEFIRSRGYPVRDLHLLEDVEPQDITYETIRVSPDVDVLHLMRRAEMMVDRENLRADRFLLGCISYLTLVAIFRKGEFGMRHIDYHSGSTWLFHRVLEWRHGEDFFAFGHPVTLDPSKPEKWVQCLPRTDMRTATYRQLPADFGVSRGMAAREAKEIRDVLQRVELPEDRKIILPDEAYEAMAKKVVVTSYWDQKPASKGEEKPWTGNEGKRRLF